MEAKSRCVRKIQSRDIHGDKELFLKIVEDMLEHAGVLRPAPNWDLSIGGKDGGKYFKETIVDGKDVPVFTEYEFNEEHYEEHFSTLNKMLDPWVGCTGMGPVTPEIAKQYIDYLCGIDHLGLLDEYFDREGHSKEGQCPLMVTDLGSMMDINLISSLLMSETKLVIVEVGGGYGRLAEVFMNLFGPDRIKYVLVDAVPASLMYSELYMKDRFPDVNIGSFYRDDDFDLEKHPCYVMPAWHFESLNANQFHVCINVQSMQEMSQEHVDYYLSLFNNIVQDRGLIYLSNEKDYVFRGQWNYPENWQKVFQNRTPRSWTRHSPTEMFLKQAEGDFSSANQLLDFMYEKQLHDYDMVEYLKRQATEASNVAADAKDIKEKLISIEQALNTSVLLKWKKG
ncbi:MAG: putative sugar O-methyltransferase [Mariprofundaceae bacterium]|nr:putative sugar O-methyltransferase [Mariprofundaceae bacterium]